MEATFADVVCNHGSPSIQCGCGVTWFTHEDEEYESLLVKSKADPEKYRESSDDAIGWGWFEGKQMVWGCPKCMERFERCESWIKDNEEFIREFLKRFGQQRLAEAQRLAAIE